jgi:hypothetical protein
MLDESSKLQSSSDSSPSSRLGRDDCKTNPVGGSRNDTGPEGRGDLMAIRSKRLPVPDPNERFRYRLARNAKTSTDHCVAQAELVKMSGS